MRAEIPARRAFRLLQSGPAVLVAASYRDRANVTATPWQTPLSLDPPLVGVALSPARFTYDLIRRSEEFVLSVPSVEHAALVRRCLHVSGRDVDDKLKLLGLTLASAQAVQAPLIEQCLGWLECGLVGVHELGDHHLLIGQVLVAWADDEAFDDTWRLDPVEARPLHLLGGPHYAALERRQAVEVPPATSAEP